MKDEAIKAIATMWAEQWDYEDSAEEAEKQHDEAGADFYRGMAHEMFWRRHSAMEIAAIYEGCTKTEVSHKAFEVLLEKEYI